MVETWKECCEGWYEVSDQGRVRRLKPGKSTKVGFLLTPGVNSVGYLQLRLRVNGRGHTTTVHKLVAGAFIGVRPAGTQVNHRDGDKTNNALSNLEYVTTAGNNHHALKAGLTPLRITQETVDRIRSLRDGGMTYNDIARATGVSGPHCCNIVNGKYRSTTWYDARSSSPGE